MNDMMIAIPKDVENLHLPDPTLLQYYKNIEDRIIWIEDEIDSALFEYSKLIMQWNKEDKDIPVDQRKPIKIFINSPGGVLEDTLSFVGLLRISKTPIWTINTGWAYSAACLIALAGHRRFAMPNTSFLLHSGSGGTGGTYEQTTEQMKQYKQLIDKMRNYIIERTNIDQKLFNKKKNTEWYITCDEALGYGMVDKIIDNLDEIL
ncbi:MAG: ClpP family protease [Candidatus Kurthia intestinigallinarum]